MAAVSRIAGSAVDLPQAAPSSRPIDLAHLARQTMGDRALEQEVLQLFIRQAKAALMHISKVPVSERLRIAHTLKGSARSVGAFALADCLVAIEQGNAQAMKSLPIHIGRVCDFVAAIGR